MKKLVLFIFMFYCYQTMAQKNEASVQVSVYFSNVPLESATVELLNSKDSSLVKTGITDKSGQVGFSRIIYGIYIIRSSSIGYENQYSQPFNLNENLSMVHLPVINMVRQNRNLEGIVITGRKPLIQKLNDRIVVNVSASALNSGSTALEVLGRSPGISIDQNSSVSLRGKQGVIVMIDGKPSPLTGNDLASYLKSLPSENIDRIDIITNPSSKYEAAGSSGIIDIHLKKDQRLGMNGMLTAVSSQGIYAKESLSGTFNFRNKKLNVFGNYTHAYRDQYDEYISKRIFSNNGVSAGSYDQDDYIKFPEHVNSGRLGIDFFPDSKNTIGIVAQGNLDHIARINNDASATINQNNQPDSGFFTKATADNQFNNIISNINFKHSFASGAEFSADADYGIFSGSIFSNNKTDFYDAQGHTQHPSYLLNGNQQGKVNIRSAKADYNKNIFNNGKLEAGLKKSIVTSVNNADFYDAGSSTPVYDPSQSNHYKYIERNTAAYINLSKEVKKFNFQLGLRAEQTKFSGDQSNGNFHFDSSYFQLFPSATINYKIRDDQTIGFAFSKRIDRPSYDQMNPLIFLLDISTYVSGNPDLIPQYTWSYEFNYTLKQVNISFNYSHTSNRITIVAFPDEKLSSPNKIVNLQTFINLPDYQYTGVTLSFPFKLTGWWNINTNGTLFRSYYKAYYNKTYLNAENTCGLFTVNNAYSFKKGWSGELNAEYNSPMREGFILGYTKWQLSAGLQKSILKNKASLKLSCTDIFRTNIDRGINSGTNYFEIWSSIIDTRSVNLSFTYRFGNSKVAASRNRTTASEEETKRASH
ncbi:MAG: TonB-dependent receptor domain-containing protein [Flavisolibacter sp.]